MNSRFFLLGRLSHLAGSLLLALSLRAGEPTLPPPKVPTPVPVPVIRLEADGIVKVNGVLLQPRAGTRQPLGLEKAVLRSTFKAVDGLIHRTWAEKAMGILVHTTQGPQDEVPKLDRLVIGVIGLKEAAFLHFRGLLELRGRLLDFSKPWRHGPKDLEMLKQPEEPTWRWTNEGRNLDFVEGSAAVYIHVPPLSDQGQWLNDVSICWPRKELKKGD